MMVSLFLFGMNVAVDRWVHRSIKWGMFCPHYILRSMAIISWKWLAIGKDTTGIGAVSTPPPPLPIHLVTENQLLLPTPLLPTPTPGPKAELGKVSKGSDLQNIFNLLPFVLVHVCFFIVYGNFFLYVLNLCDFSNKGL